MSDACADARISKLDGPLRARFRRFVFDHARRRGLPTLLVTHDPDDAAATDGPIVALQAAEHADGPPAGSGGAPPDDDGHSLSRFPQL